MPTTTQVGRADILSEISDEYRCVGGLHSHQKVLDFLYSPYTAYVIHTDEQSSSLTLVRDGVEQARIIIDEDGTIRTRTWDSQGDERTTE